MTVPPQPAAAEESAIPPGPSVLPDAMPPWARPLGRLAIAILLVVAGDLITGVLIDRGLTLPLGVMTVVRVLSALPILRFPLAGFLVALEVDKWDWYWLDAGNRGDDFEAFYDGWDKVLDLLVLGAAAVVAWGWRDRLMRALALAAFGWRALGTMVFLMTERGWTLVIFPNVFQSLFLMYLVYYLVSGRPRMLRSRWVAAIAVLAALVPKVAEEYFIHVMGGRPWDHVPLPTPDVLEPFIWLVLIYVPAVLVVAVLAITTRGDGRSGDREAQLGVA